MNEAKPFTKVNIGKEIDIAALPQCDRENILGKPLSDYLDTLPTDTTYVSWVITEAAPTGGIYFNETDR